MNIWLRLWYRLVGEPTRANAVRSMEKSLRKLETANAYQAAKAVSMQEAAKRAEEAAVTANAEAERARKVRDNLAALLEA